jgi:hypothetical protein
MVLRWFERDYPEHWDPEVYEETKRTGKFRSPMSNKKQPVTRHWTGWWRRPLYEAYIEQMLAPLKQKA